MAKKLTKQAGFTLIELLVVMGILAVLLAAVLVAINPDRQFKQARDTQRRNDVLTILNAVQQNIADNKGLFVGGSLTSTPTDISHAGLDICAALSPTYVSILPSDPKTGTPNTGVIDCTSATYDSKYLISQDTSGRITVAATPEIATAISVTR